MGLYVLVWALDDQQFKQQQDQSFEGPDQQQQFEEGKWPLIILVNPENSINSLYFMRMHVSII